MCVMNRGRYGGKLAFVAFLVGVVGALLQTQHRDAQIVVGGTEAGHKVESDTVVWSAEEAEEDGGATSAAAAVAYAANAALHEETDVAVCALDELAGESRVLTCAAGR